MGTRALDRAPSVCVTTFFNAGGGFQNPPDPLALTFKKSPPRNPRTLYLGEQVPGGLNPPGPLAVKAPGGFQTPRDLYLFGAATHYYTTYHYYTSYHYYTPCSFDNTYQNGSINNARVTTQQPITTPHTITTHHTITTLHACSTSKSNTRTR